MPRLYLWLAALGFIVVGVMFLFWPLPLALSLGMPLTTPTARVDFAATYGGFQLGFGAFLMFCAVREEWTRAGVIAASFAFGGFAVGRLHGMLFAPAAPEQKIYWFLALEITGTVAGIAAARALRMPRR
jgi:Domain of unknown function (DUF4345)